MHIMTPLDHSKAVRELGWQPASTPDAIARAARFFRGNRRNAGVFGRSGNRINASDPFTVTGQIATLRPSSALSRAASSTAKVSTASAAGTGCGPLPAAAAAKRA